MTAGVARESYYKTMLSVSNLSLAHKKTLILDKVNLEVQAGEISALIGPNGAGKSSLLKCIAGHYSKFDGDISLHGKPTRHWSSSALAKVRAILSQQIQFGFDLSVLEIIKFGRFPYLKSESPKKSQAIAEWCLDQVAMTSFATRNMLSLSGGEQQRVHFARVLAQLYSPDESQAKLLLLDEPTASLDIAQKHNLLQCVMEAVQRFGYAALMVVHDVNLAAQYADQLTLLKKGEIVTQGATTQVLTRQAIQRTFGMDVLIQTHPISQCPQICPLASPYHATARIPDHNTQNHPHG